MENLGLNKEELLKFEVIKMLLESKYFTNGHNDTIEEATKIVAFIKGSTEVTKKVS